jgi:oxygen-dependent protoporphyrinogen oxidase
MSPKVVIVGGGIAGLSTAYELMRAGVPFVLLEDRPRAGGVILTEEIDGLVIDAGPDSLLVQKPDGIKLCQEVGLGDRLVPTRPPRLAYIQRGGQLHPLPAASVLGIPTEWVPFLRTDLFSWRGKLRMGLELLIPARRDGADESIGAFMRRRFGEEAVTYLAEPLLAGIHAGDVDRLSVQSLFPRFVEAERVDGSLLRGFRRRARNSAPVSAGRAAAAVPGEGAFRSLPGGLSEMVRAIERLLPAASLRLGTKVTEVGTAQAHFVVRTAAGDTIEAASVVLATPAFATAPIVRSLDGQIASLCGEIRYASAATVAFAFDRSAVRHPLNGSGFVVPRAEGTGILAASWLSSKWPNRAPDNQVLMRTFLGGARDPEALQLSDREMITRSLSALTSLLGISGAPLFTRVYRWERSNAQHEVGHAARMAALERALGSHPGLFLTGSAFRGVGIPDCVADGRATGRQVAQWLASTRSEDTLRAC